MFRKLFKVRQLKKYIKSLDKNLECNIIYDDCDGTGTHEIVIEITNLLNENCEILTNITEILYNNLKNAKIKIGTLEFLTPFGEMFLLHNYEMFELKKDKLFTIIINCKNNSDCVENFVNDSCNRILECIQIEMCPLTKSASTV